MDKRNQVVHFAKEIENVIDRFREEYDLTLCDMIGALALCSHDLCNEAFENAPDEEDDEDLGDEDHSEFPTQ
jgi:hypothetical protein